MMKQENC